MNKPDMTNCTDKQFDKWYWNIYHDVCNKCSNTCKQSSIVIQVVCNKFRKKEDVN